MMDDNDIKLLFKPADTSDPVTYFYKNSSPEAGCSILERLAKRKLGRLDLSHRDGQALVAFLIKKYPDSKALFVQTIKKHIVKREHKYLEQALAMTEECKDPSNPCNIDQYWENTALQLDIMWLGFSITGEIKYVQRILDALERGDGSTLYRGSMTWSIESNVKLHKDVHREILTRAFVKKSKNPHLLKMLERIKS